MFRNFSERTDIGFRSIRSDANGMIATVSRNRIPAAYGMIDDVSGGNVQRAAHRRGGSDARIPERSAEVTSSERNGVLKFCRGVPTLPVEEYLKYADSIPYT